MLWATDISAAYGDVPVLSGVSFGVDAGTVLVLLGRNGVGKTTLMRTLVGLLPTTEGKIILEKQDVTKMPAYRRARLGIGYVPQGRGIIPRLTVRENLLIGTRARGDRTGEIQNHVLDHFSVLKERLNQMGGTLSGGEQQMLALARALCGQPRILLLDEPSEGIQPSVVQLIEKLIRRIVQETGIAVLLVEQNLELALGTADRCMVMEKGRIVHEGSPDEFKDERLLREYLAI